MAKATTTNFVGLDFNDTKQNLIEYLRKQDRFKDFDFEGSNLSILVDMLAYNTHYNALYQNFAINENFLDSARKRSSVVSRASENGYLPRSAKSPMAIADIDLEGVEVTQNIYVLPALSPFKTTIDGDSYTFYNRQAIQSSVVNDQYVFKGVELYEGKQLSIKYTVSEGVRYIIPNANCDVGSVKVRVQESAQVTDTVIWSKSDNIIAQSSESPVYYMKEIEGGLYEIFFGDGVLSKAVESGNVVTIDYFITKGEEANGAGKFTYTGRKLGNGQIKVNVTSRARGGSQIEPIEDVRISAKAYIEHQNRGVTPNDYAQIIKSEMPSIESISVWGGEDNTPPIYGKVFISAKPKGGDRLSIDEREYIKSSVLGSKKTVGIVPEIVNPEYIDIMLDITANYDSRKSLADQREIAAYISDKIVKFEKETLIGFQGIFRYSKFSTLIDNADESINNNTAKIKLKKRLMPKFDTNASYTINFANPIFKSGTPKTSILSDGFFIAKEKETYYIDDDGNGKVRLFTYDTFGRKVIKNDKIGTVDYESGVIKFSPLNISGLAEQRLFFYVIPASNDVVAKQNQIIRFDKTSIEINMIPDSTDRGDVGAGSNYKFTPRV